MPYQLPSLPFAYDALEPHIDARTMEIHHSKHHKAYVDKLNQALGSAQIQIKTDEPVEDLIGHLNDLPATIRQAVRDNGGGHANHSLFWSLLTPKAQQTPPPHNLLAAIVSSFGSFENFKEQLSKIALSHVGSGWAWLYVDANKKTLSIGTTLNHDSPLMRGTCPLQGAPLLVIDLWEHAYYLNYQNRRADYLQNIWEIVNWKAVGERL